MLLKKRVLELYNNPAHNTVVLCLDEKGPVAAKEYGGTKWCGDVPEIDIRQKTKGLVCCFGAYDPHRKELFVKTYEKKTSNEFIDFVEEIRKHWRYVKIAIILDNARIHKSNKTKNALSKYKSIDFVFLPTNSPDLNRIEGVWNNMQSEAINNHRFENKDEVVACVMDWVDFHNNERKEI